VTGLSVRELRAHPRRAMLTGVAVIVGVALVSGTLVLGDTAVRAGVQDSDVDQLRRILHAHGGSALVRSAPGAGTEVELHMPRRTRHG
jgi:hypothetical protein